LPADDKGEGKGIKRRKDGAILFSFCRFRGTGGAMKRKGMRI
jgi:hypothetical protein